MTAVFFDMTATAMPTRREGVRTGSTESLHRITLRAVRTRWHFCALVFLFTEACGGSVDTHSAASTGGAPNDEPLVDAGPKCGPTPAVIPGLSKLVPPNGGVVSGSVAIDLVVNATDLFYVIGAGQPTQTRLMRAPIHGGVPVLVTHLQSNEQALLMTPTGVLVAESEDSTEMGSGKIVRVSFDGHSVVDVSPYTGSVGNLATDGSRLYFADADGTKSVPLTGGDVTVLTTKTGSIALVGSNIVIADNAEGVVFEVPAAGGTVEMLSTNQAGAEVPFACGSDLCWTTGAEGPPPGSPPGTGYVAGEGVGTIVELAPGASPKTLVQSASLYPIWRIVFGGDRFFASVIGDASSGDVVTVPAGGGDVAEIGFGSGIAIDESCLYMSNISFGIWSVSTSYGGDPSM